MKKVLLILVIAMMVPMMASAGSTTNAGAGEPLKLANLTIAMSPGVFSYYEDDAAPTPQWYLIATVHQGGTKAYATAQNSTSIMKIAVPVEPMTVSDLSGLTFPTQTASASVDGWPTGWSQ